MTEVPLGELRNNEMGLLLRGEVISIIFTPHTEGNPSPLGVQKNLSWIDEMHVLQEERLIKGFGYNVGFLLTYYFAGVTPSYTISFATETPFTHDFYTEIEKFGLDQPDQDIYNLFLYVSKITGGLL